MRIPSSVSKSVFLTAFILLGSLHQSATAETRSSLNTRVIGGGFANPSQYSVAMIYSASGSLCSGSAVSKRTILTAAHCAFIASQKGAVAIVRGRRYNLVSGRKAPGGVDVGVVRTSSDISAPLINVPQGVRISVGQKFLLLGFGDPTPGKLSAGYMTISGYVNSNEFLANAFEGQNACSGDSGGPALVTYYGRTSVIGVVSRGPSGCKSGNSVVFPLTTTTATNRWIKQQN